MRIVTGAWKVAAAKPTATVWLAASAMLAVAVQNPLLAVSAIAVLALIGMFAVAFFYRREMTKVHRQCDYLNARVEQLAATLGRQGIPVPPPPPHTEE